MAHEPSHPAAGDREDFRVTRGGVDFDVVAAPLAALGPLEVHGMYRLRVDVFVHEQDCPYAEIDEVDARADCVHLVAREAGAGAADVPAATLRVFGAGPAGSVRHIGRVCTAAGQRGRGLAGALVAAALERCAGHPVEIGAQSYLEDWYGTFGFVRVGPEYLDERIPHIPMRREPAE